MNRDYSIAKSYSPARHSPSRHTSCNNCDNGPCPEHLGRRFVNAIKEVIEENKIIEKKKIALSLRYDYNLIELFRVINESNNGYVSLFELEKFGHSSGKFSFKFL